mmetsp:Transcript_15241/g.47589  ORF Transcript_15241/g.47589 Transcript_15241/m.47589 type:complete len:285 (-) Transcript_15241:17-871(-)
MRLHAPRHCVDGQVRAGGDSGRGKGAGKRGCGRTEEGRAALRRPAAVEGAGGCLEGRRRQPRLGRGLLRRPGGGQGPRGPRRQGRPCREGRGPGGRGHGALEVPHGGQAVPPWRRGGDGACSEECPRRRGGVRGRGRQGLRNARAGQRAPGGRFRRRGRRDGEEGGRGPEGAGRRVEDGRLADHGREGRHEEGQPPLGLLGRQAGAGGRRRAWRPLLPGGHADPGPGGEDGRGGGQAGERGRPRAGLRWGLHDLRLKRPGAVGAVGASGMEWISAFLRMRDVAT